VLSSFGNYAQRHVVVKIIVVIQDDIVTYVARCLYVDNGRNVHPDVVKSKMSDYFPISYMSNHGSNNKARDALARAVMTSFERQGFSGYAVPAKYVSILVYLYDLHDVPISYFNVFASCAVLRY